MKLNVQELIKSINEDVSLIGNLEEITENNLKQLLNHLCDIYDKSAVIKVLKSEDSETVVSEYVVVDEVENKIDSETEDLLDIAEKQISVPSVDDEIELPGAEEKDAEQRSKERYEHKISLHEKIAKEKEDISLALKLQRKPIYDLDKAIGLNEKILFTKDLFGGNSEEFKNHLNQINSKANFEEAKLYLDSNVIPVYNWKGDDPAATHFITLLQRRFVNA